ncbi:MAG: peptide chain release factor N(5)-glutamine methyltransferase [Nitrospirota bacterium]
MVEKRLADYAEVAQLIMQAGKTLSLSGVENPNLEAETLMAEALGAPGRSGVFMRLREEPDQAVKNRFADLVSRRAMREPTQYILGRAEFLGRMFQVNPAVLIPRPETELLAREGADFLKSLDSPLAADIGTGSGCIAVTLALEVPGAFIYALDCSDGALSIARANADKSGAAGRMEFLRGDLLQPLSGMGLRGKLDLAVSNPPYIPTDDIPKLQPEVLFEPVPALDGGLDGLGAIRRLVHEAPLYLRPGGKLMLEIGFGQAGAVREMVNDEPGLEIEKIVLDFAGIERIIIAVKR